MLTFALPIVDFNNSRTYVDDLYSSDTNRCLAALIRLKNTVIGSNRQKGIAISQGLVPRLMQMIGDPDLPTEIRNEAIVIIGSLTKGTEDQVKELVKADIVPQLLNCILHQEDNRFAENCLRAVFTIFHYDFAPVHLIFENNTLLSRMLSLLRYSVSCQIAITTILSVSLKTPENQDMLWNEGAVFSLAALLGSPYHDVLMPTLKCISCFCHNNRNVACSIVSASFGGKSMPDLLVALMSRNKPLEMQLYAAKCITYLYRTETLNSDDPRIVYKALPVLVYLCQSTLSWDVRVDAAETLAYLTENSPELQKLAAISNHLIVVLTAFINFKGDSTVSSAKLDQIKTELLQAGFKVLASLAANEEHVRKKIIESDNIAGLIVQSLDHRDNKVRLAAIRCLHSLSRSVQQLRTTFQFMCATQDHNVWKPLLGLLENATDDMLILASSTLCNLLLEFSPAKEPIIESGAVDLLCGLINREEPVLRLNGIWALMNMAFQTDQKIKNLILSTIGMERMYRLINDPDENILIKTFGLLRNVISPKSQIDLIMNNHGADIRKMCKIALDGTHSSLVVEQAICVLANIADGDNSKDFIMNDNELVHKLRDFTLDENIRIQTAAVFTITNLVWNDNTPSAQQRQAKFKELGIIAILRDLINSPDNSLFEKSKTALAQFPDEQNNSIA